MTLAEVHLFIEGGQEQERARQKEAWRRTAFLTAHVVNFSGMHDPPRKRVKPKDLISFLDEKKPAPDAEWLEQRKRQAAETLRQHKAKFWMLINDDEIKKNCGDN